MQAQLPIGRNPPGHAEGKSTSAKIGSEGSRNLGNPPAEPRDAALVRVWLRAQGPEEPASPYAASCQGGRWVPLIADVQKGDARGRVDNSGVALFDGHVLSLSSFFSLSFVVCFVGEGKGTVVVLA